MLLNAPPPRPTDAGGAGVLLSLTKFLGKHPKYAPFTLNPPMVNPCADRGRVNSSLYEYQLQKRRRSRAPGVFLRILTSWIGIDLPCGDSMERAPIGCIRPRSAH